GIIKINDDPSDPVILGTMTTYTQQGYNHSCWLSEDGDYLIMCDETHGTDIKVVDVSNFSNPEVIATMNAESDNNQIVHNVIIQDNLVYASYYYDGLQVFDISNPAFPRRIAYYDTHAGPNTGWFAGAWGVFVMPSGQVLISDMNTGFYHFDVVEVPVNTSLIPSVNNLIACEEEARSFTMQIGDGFDDGGVSLSASGLPAGTEVTFSNDNPLPGTAVEVTVTGVLGTRGNYELLITAADGINDSETTIDVEITGVPMETELIGPGDGSDGLNPNFIVFSWTFDPLTTQANLQVSADPNFDSNVDLVFTVPVTGTSVILPITLEEGTTYYWRILSANSCGEGSSDVYTFRTDGATNTIELQDLKVDVQPNPAADYLQLVFNQVPEQNWQVEWIAANGQLVRTEQLTNLSQQVVLSTIGLAEGFYSLRLSSAKQTISRRLLIQR
ncbi:MAG: T9SS type A sorting domain-containing protein, partial [Bacteroidota bacterium]